MSEHARSEVAELATATRGLAEMVKSRSRRVNRETHELRRLAAQLANAAELLDAAIAAEHRTDTREGYGT